MHKYTPIQVPVTWRPKRKRVLRRNSAAAFLSRLAASSAVKFTKTSAVTTPASMIAAALAMRTQAKDVFTLNGALTSRSLSTFLFKAQPQGKISLSSSLTKVATFLQAIPSNVPIIALVAKAVSQTKAVIAGTWKLTSASSSLAMSAKSRAGFTGTIPLLAKSLSITGKGADTVVTAIFERTVSEIQVQLRSVGTFLGSFRLKSMVKTSAIPSPRGAVGLTLTSSYQTQARQTPSFKGALVALGAVRTKATDALTSALALVARGTTITNAKKLNPNALVNLLGQAATIVREQKANIFAAPAVALVAMASMVSKVRANTPNLPAALQARQKTITQAVLQLAVKGARVWAYIFSE